jgi:hypothetical protein
LENSANASSDVCGLFINASPRVMMPPMSATTRSVLMAMDFIKIVSLIMSTQL